MHVEERQYLLSDFNPLTAALYSDPLYFFVYLQGELRI